MKRLTLAVCILTLAAFALAAGPTTKPAAKKFPYLSDKMNETVEITRAELAAMKAERALETVYAGAALSRAKAQVSLGDTAVVVLVTIEERSTPLVKSELERAAALAPKVLADKGYPELNGLGVPQVTIKEGREVVAHYFANTGKITTKFDK